MGRIGRIIQFARMVLSEGATNANVSDVTIDSGGGIHSTAQHFASAGDDSHPLLTDMVVMVPVPSGRFSAVGYIDPINTPKALEGDKRIYSRDGSTGNITAEVWLKADGTITGVNQNGQFELQSGGDFVINGVTIDVNGNIMTNGTITTDVLDASTSILGAGVELVDHSHCYIPGTNTPTKSSSPAAAGAAPTC